MRCPHALTMLLAAVALVFLAGCGQDEPKFAQGPPDQSSQPEPMTFESSPSQADAAESAGGGSESGSGSGSATGDSNSGPAPADAGSAPAGSNDGDQPKPERMDMPPAGSGQQTYTVQAGDTLYSLAKRFLGDGQQWQRIIDANPDLNDPKQLRVGQKIVIPGQ